MWWIFFVLFFLVSVVSSTLLYFSLRRINQYEDLIIRFQQLVSYSTEHMKRVDAKGHYEADDETGFFFEQLKQIQLSLDGMFEVEKIDAEEKSSKEKSSKKES